MVEVVFENSRQKKKPNMMYLSKRVLVFTGMILSVVVSFSQYPEVSGEDERRSDSLLRAARKHSDSAWAIAWPIIMQEAKQGKPFLEFANRPTDLPQADIPAFPGAEGGGGALNE